MPVHLKVHTDQEAFDLIVRHLSMMRTRAGFYVDGMEGDPVCEFSCMYIMADGSRCAVGALIDDDDIGDLIDVQCGVEEMAQRYADIDAYDRDDPNGHRWEGVSMRLLGQLQNMHDRAENWGPNGFEAWGQLHVVAAAFGLHSTVVFDVTEEVQ